MRRVRETARDDVEITDHPPLVEALPFGHHLHPVVVRVALVLGRWLQGHAVEGAEPCGATDLEHQSLIRRASAPGRLDRAPRTLRPLGRTARRASPRA